MDDKMPRKGLAAMLIANKGPMEHSEEEGSDEGEGQDAAAEEMMAALDSGDVAGFKEALNAFLDMR
tara:strand:+ start:4805 stop:5002 length:198 start_codon:yes stop_codon:yes gene_type:complete